MVVRTDSRGSAARGLLIFLVVLVVLALMVGGCGVSKYNGLVTAQENVQRHWGEIQNQYKRRFDLIPNLLKTVQGAADFERSVLTEVTEARASVGRVQLPDSLPTEPEALQAYMRAQQGLGAALGRLFAVSENYPQLKTSQNFLSFQDQLEGTENRIAVARRDYIDGVAFYNAAIRKFPANIIASMFGDFERAAQLEFDEAEQAVPDVDFNFGK